MYTMNHSSKAKHTRPSVKLPAALLSATLTLQLAVPGIAMAEPIPAATPTLTAIGDNANNMVRLNWTSSQAGQEYYMVYQKETGGSELDEYQSIPLKKDIKVLNVYPDVAGSDGLQAWMQTYGNPNGYTMQVDKIAMSDFNGDDSSRNYEHYLAKNPNGSYNYDVLYFGAWDVNNRHDLIARSHAAVEAFIQYGGGVLVGHDTASFNHQYFIDIAQKYLNMSVNFQEGYPNPSIPPTGSDQVIIQRRGFPMNYPYALGDVGTILSTPTSHSYFQFARGDVWFKYANINWGWDVELTSYENQKGTNNFYLTTWNNAAMIQTGHSMGQAREDEQKILANTLFYLGQISTDNSFDDRMSQDVAAPDAVAGSSLVVSSGIAAGKQLLSWAEAADHGSSYSYYLKAISYIDGTSRVSDETEATVTTGVKGYAIKIDTDSSDVDPGNVVTTTTNSFETENLQPGVTYYAHIKTIDNAGNVSAMGTFSFAIDAPALTASSTDPAGAIHNGKTKLSVAESIQPGNKLVYFNAGDSKIITPAIGDVLNGYAELPASGLVAAEDGDKLAVAEVDANGRVVRFGYTKAQVIASAEGLPVSSVDPAGSSNNGKTQMVATASSGKRLVYINMGTEAVVEPDVGAVLTGYAALPENGIIAAVRGDRIGIAELDEDGKVVRFGAARAVVSDESEATGLVATATAPVGAGTEGKTRVAVSATPGNKLVYVNFKNAAANVPTTGSSLSGLGYAELPASGLVNAEQDDLLGVAEVDPSGKVVKYTTVYAVVAAAGAAKNLAVGAQDAVGEDSDGKTQLTVNVSAGRRLVYVNFGQGPAVVPAAGETVGSTYAEVPAGGAVAAKHGDLLGVAEVDEQGRVIRYGTTQAVVASDNAAGRLPAAATDAVGAGTDGKTKIVSKAAEGNKLMYVNFGEGPVQEPGRGDTLAGYQELPENGIIAAKPGDRIGLVEIGPDGQVIKYGATAAVVVPEKAAKNLPVVSTDPTGEGTDGYTKVATAAGITVAQGNKLVYLNAGVGTVAVPEAGAVLSGYTDMPASGMIEAAEGDYIGIAEVDGAGRVVRFGTTKAVVEAEAAAKGLTASASDPAGEGTDGKTKLATGTAADEGNTLVYLNFGQGAVRKPNVGDTLNGYATLPADGVVPADNGDLIGIAEVDATGKVVRFGVTTAVTHANAAAQALEVTASDPQGSANDGKTKLRAQAAADNKLVYVNYGSAQVIVPNTGEILAGYVELPKDGLVRAAHGDHIAVAELDASGRVVRFGYADAIVVQEPVYYSSGTTVTAPDTPATTTNGVEVLVNGKVEYAGTATVSTEQGRTLTTIDVDQAKLQAKLDAEGVGAVVTIPWQTPSELTIGQLTGQMVKNMEDKSATLVLQTPTGAYKVPMKQIQMSALASQLNQSAKLEDVKLQLHVSLVTPKASEAAAKLIARADATLIASPVTFKVEASYAGKSIEIKDYSVYVERTIALPADVDPNKITTGVVLEENGTLRHVPTKVTKLNETYYAQINSLTNSDYAVIWHPLEFADVANHWSKEAVNDMGSRLIVNGVGEGKFNPNAEVTRAEFAAIIVRGLGLRLEQGSVPFSDVAAGKWYAEAVNTAYSFGLITGYEDGTFRPQGKITRQEAMTIIARAMQITGLKGKLVSDDLSQVLLGYKDADQVSAWAKEGASLSIAAKIVNGRTADTLAAGAYITRAEVAAIVQRLLQASELI